MEPQGSKGAVLAGCRGNVNLSDPRHLVASWHHRASESAYLTLYPGTAAVFWIGQLSTIAECVSTESANAKVIREGNDVTAEILDGAMMNFIALRFHAREKKVVTSFASAGWKRTRIRCVGRRPSESAIAIVMVGTTFREEVRNISPP